MTSVCVELWVYVDGSYDEESGHGGAGVVLYAYTAHGWTFAGATSAFFPVCRGGAYEAEQRAAVMAVKVVHDFCKITMWPSGQPIVHMFLDNLAVCKQTDGTWGAHRNPHLQLVVRGIMQLVERRYRAHVSLHHAHSHMGDPGNETADVLAAEGRDGKPLEDWQTFFGVAGSAEFGSHVGWFWILFDPPVYRGWDGLDLLLPLSRRQWHRPPWVSGTGRLWMRRSRALFESVRNLQVYMALRARL